MPLFLFSCSLLVLVIDTFVWRDIFYARQAVSSGR